MTKAEAAEEAPKTIRIIGAYDGQPRDVDGQYVKLYDPTFHPPDEEYFGGILEVTPNRADALHFHDAGEAVQAYMQSHGIRPDGKPNRPLTAFSVEIS